MGIVLFIFWFLDVVNASFMGVFDTTCAINGLAWALIWLAYFND